MGGAIAITGRDLDPATVAAIARDRAPVEIDPAARARIEQAHAVVELAVSEGRPVYGVTTGLGSRVVDRVDGGDAAAYSLSTVRGRATAVGEPLDAELTRAAMAVRLNGLCAGGSGAGIAVADGLAALLNAGVHPRVPRSGSVGAADLCMLAHVGLVLIGEGEAELGGRRAAGGAWRSPTRGWNRSRSAPRTASRSARARRSHRAWRRSRCSTARRASRRRRYRRRSRWRGFERT